MAIRVRFDITLTVTLKADGFFSKPEGFLDIAQIVCIDGFAKHNPQLNTRYTLMEGGRVAFHMLWDVDLADAPGARFDDPNDHVTHLEMRLAAHFGAEMDVQIWRKADLDEAVDHTDIVMFHNDDFGPEDFPVFRPEPHADWEEADEVWLQDGVWFWAISEEMAKTIALDPFEGRGPSVGPDPEAIYTPWEDDFLERDRATKARNAEILARLAGRCVAA